MWDYAEGVFPSGMIEAMYQEFISYIGTVSESDWNSELTFSLSSRITGRYRKLNDTAESTIGGGLMFADFLEIAKKQQQSTAVVSGSVSLTYRQLRNIAYSIAEKLIAMGVRPGEPVLIHTERGWKEIVSALGIQLAGGAYTGVRKTDSLERSRNIAGKCGAAIVITDEDSTGICEKELLINDEYLKAIPQSEQAVDDRIARLSSDQLAYIIFTSGSTGEPKGVQITHEAAMNTIRAVNRRCGTGSEDAVLAISALRFDLSVYDIFWNAECRRKDSHSTVRPPERSRVLA